MTESGSSAEITLSDAILPAFLCVVREMVTFANSGGGMASVPDLQLTESVRITQLAPAALARLVQPYAGPPIISIQRIMRLPPPSNEAIVFVGGVEEAPLVLKCDSPPCHGSPETYPAGSILVRRAGRVAAAVYSEVIELFGVIAENAYRPDSATALLDVTLARRARNSSALLDRMDLLWCLIERESIELTPPRLDLLLRSSLRRTPTLYFWLAGLAESSLVEKVLLTSIDDDDRDTSDAKDSILEVAALFASDAYLQTILEKMSRSEYAHFRQAASDWLGRRAALNAFAQRVTSVRLDGQPAADWPTSALYRQAEELALKIMTEGGSNRQLGDIGRVVFCLQTPARCPAS